MNVMSVDGKVERMTTICCVCHGELGRLQVLPYMYIFLVKRMASFLDENNNSQ